MFPVKLPRLSFWRVIVALIFVTGAYAMLVRFFQGLGASTNLTDTVPWGLWVGFNTLCGVGLSAGGFTVAAALYILGLERYRPVIRAAILAAFLGYLTVVVGMLFELGLPWRIWHPIVLWNRSSVLFEVAWCVMLYTTVLALEFSPAVLERIPWPRLRAWITHFHHRILIALVLVGIVLSSLHQSFLGGLYLITKSKLHPLWYSSQLPALFLLSAIPAGLAVVIMALYLSVRSLRARVDAVVLEEISRVIPLLIGFYALFRGVDLYRSGNLHYIWQPRIEMWWFWLEILLFIALPLVLFTNSRVRANPFKLYWSCALVVMGFTTNRINVAITGLEESSGVTYVPKWTEFMMTVMVFTAAVLAFRFAVLHLSILPRADEAPAPEWFRAAVPARRVTQARPRFLQRSARH